MHGYFADRVISPQIYFVLMLVPVVPGCDVGLQAAQVPIVSAAWRASKFLIILVLSKNYVMQSVSCDR